MRRVRVLLLGLVCAHFLSTPAAQAQGNSYKQTNLVSDTQGLAPVIDPNLVNPWGICIIPGEDIWIADNASPTGVSSSYLIRKMEPSPDGRAGHLPSLQWTIRPSLPLRWARCIKDWPLSPTQLAAFFWPPISAP